MKSPNKSPNVYLHAISTCVPEHNYSQSFALDFFLGLQGNTPRKREFFQKVYANTGIQKRHTVIDDYGKKPTEYTFYAPNSEMLPEPTLKARNQVFERESNRLSADVAGGLLRQLPSFDRQKITHLITVSCTGFSAPGFDQHLVRTLDLKTSVHRFHIGFMGCYAAFPALKLSRDICLADPEARVLIVSVELCSLHFQQKFSPESIVANAIFADGAAAAIISAQKEDSPGPKLIMNRFFSELIDNSERDMAWTIGEHAFDMRLSLYVPQLIEQNIRSMVTAQMDAENRRLQEIDIWAIHPGGRAILDKIRNEFGLLQDDLQSSYQTLANYGNLSSATIFFVLADILKRDCEGTVFTAAFGPGLTVESGLLEKVAAC